MGICLRSRQQDSVQPSVLQFIQFSNVCSALCLSVSQPLAPAHSVGLTQHCCGWTPRITRCSRLELCSGERSDITAWSVVSRMTHGTRQKKTAGNITRSETTALTTENHLGLFTLWRLKQGNTLGGSRNEQLFTSGFTSLSYKWMTMNDSLAFLKQQYWFACFLWSLTWFFISGYTHHFSDYRFSEVIKSLHCSPQRPKVQVFHITGFHMASLLFFKYAINKKRIHLVTFIQHLEKGDGFPLLLKALLSWLPWWRLPTFFNKWI